MEVGRYIELDASFRAAEPYCYALVNVIRNNESVTVALSLGMTENTDLYEMAYQAIERSGIPRALLNRLPVLSDMGRAISSFCANRGIQQFLCHRHIIESFGEPEPKSWVVRLLACPTKTEYKELSAQIAAEIRLWKLFNRQKESEKVDKVLEMLHPMSMSHKYARSQWALWKRTQYHVARCSNHSEAMHRVLNQDLQCGFVKRFMRICQKIRKHYDRQNESHGDSLKRRYRKLRQFEEGRPSDDSTFLPDGEDCSCGWNDFHSSLLGVRFPCLHEMRQTRFRECPKAPPLALQPYNLANTVVVSNQEQPSEFPKTRGRHRPDVRLPKELDREKLFEPIAIQGPRSKKSRREFWAVVKELQEIMTLDSLTAIDIAMVIFHKWGLFNEEDSTPENIANFRIECWTIPRNQKKTTPTNKQTQ